MDYKVLIIDYEGIDRVYILEDTILPTHEKIKAIRKFLKINQKELAGDGIDRSLISYIENGKVKLSNETAKVLANNLRKILQRKNLDYQVDADYLLADEKKQVSYKLNTIIEILKTKIKNSSSEFLKELYIAEELLRKWDIPSKKAAIYDLAGDYFFTKLNYHKSKFYYMKAIGNYFRLNDFRKLANVCTKVGRCLLKRGDYEGVISLNEYALSIMEDFKVLDKSLRKRILFNNSLALYKIKSYEESLNCLDKLVSEFKISQNSNYMDVLLLKGNIYIEIGRFEEGLKIYKQLLDLSKKNDNLEKMASAYNNMGEVYYKLKDIDKSIEFLEKSLRIRKEINSIYLISTIKSFIDKLFEVGKYSKAKKYLLELSDIAKNKGDMSLLIETYCKLIDIFIVSSVSIEDKSIIDEMVKFINKNDEVKGIEVLIVKLCKYLVDKDIYKIRDLFSKS
ncbi:tetratricopeptide repeat protein [Caloranaerobacter ferrireducens]|uniref:tetratricopeptide repeat protein n=1 Tax=Caloranaerobacter ferrireducens TaxID=1323370 RepID=UPI0009F3DD8E|nr:tetratricopeptide repeat protein [Caloranaerobacter ferrireducens]